MSRKKRNRVNATGRSERDRFVQLPHALLDSAAWKALHAGPRAAYVELERRYDGRNNGEISFGVRELAKKLHVNKDTASKFLRELQRKGFIKVSEGSTFDTAKGHLATTWILTRHGLGPGRLPTWASASWRSSADDFEVFDGAASHQKARRRERKQSEHPGPSVTPTRTESEKQSDPSRQGVPETRTTEGGSGPALGPRPTDTSSVPGGVQR